MTDRPEEIQRRLTGLNEIGEVVGALKAIASGQTATARAAQPAITAYAQTVAAAMAAARAATGEAKHPEGPGILLVIGAAQGFSGAYPASIADAARKALTPGTGLVVVGLRTLGMLQETGLAADWSEDLPGHPPTIPALASRITDKLIEMAPRHPGPIRAVLGPAQPGAAPEIRAIFPPATTPDHAGHAPLTTLPAAALLAGLLHETLFATVAHALMQGAEAEAQARVAVMARAQSTLHDRRREVERAYQQVRQEQMTSELIELSSARPDLAT